MEGGKGSGREAALAELSSNDDPAPPTKEAPASVAAPLRNSRLSTKLFLDGTGSFSLGMIDSPAFLDQSVYYVPVRNTSVRIYISQKRRGRRLVLPLL
jgi:hypothetical protein